MPCDDPELSLGTAITVLLMPPARQDMPADEPAQTNEPAPSDGPLTILVIDDELDVRRVATRMLERLGYKALTAGDGLSGIAIARKQQDEIKGILLDLTMPRLSGEETVARLQAVIHVPILLMSGYSEQEMHERFGQGNVAGFVQKPFTLAKLNQALQKAFAKSSPTD